MSKVLLFSGRMVDPFDLRETDIDIRDIAHSLSNTCRWNGHASQFYSVAEHSVLVSMMVEQHGPVVAMHGLLHDAYEAYTFDAARPYKHRILVQTWWPAVEGIGYWSSKTLEKHETSGLRVIFRALAVPSQVFPLQMSAIIDADNAMCAQERRILMPPHPDCPCAPPRPDEHSLLCLSQDLAEREFLSRYAQLRERIERAA